MNVCGHENNVVTLPIHGRERTFSKQELIAILEKYFSDEATEDVITEKMAPVPTEDQLFEVNPQAIDKSLFKNERTNFNQEKTRELILDAFVEVENNPQKYNNPFYTLVPKKNWKDYKTVTDLKKYANDLGGCMADWVEQALEWAQRISNGESWEAVCNNIDTANWYRIIVWDNNCFRLIGGSRKYGDCYSASEISYRSYKSYNRVNYTVPLIAIKKI